MTYYTLSVDENGSTSMAAEGMAGLGPTDVTVMAFRASSQAHALRILRAVLEVSDAAGLLEWRARVMRTR